MSRHRRKPPGDRRRQHERFDLEGRNRELPAAFHRELPPSPDDADEPMAVAQLADIAARSRTRRRRRSDDKGAAAQPGLAADGKGRHLARRGLGSALRRRTEPRRLPPLGSHFALVYGVERAHRSRLTVAFLGVLGAFSLAIVTTVYVAPLLVLLGGLSWLGVEVLRALSGTVRERRVLRRGEDAVGRVAGVSSALRTHDRCVEVEVEFEVAKGEAITASTGIARKHLERPVRRGDELALRFDPRHPERIVVPALRGLAAPADDAVRDVRPEQLDPTPLAGAALEHLLDERTTMLARTTPPAPVRGWLRRLLARRLAAARASVELSAAGLTLVRSDGRVVTLALAAPWTVHPAVELQAHGACALTLQLATRAHPRDTVTLGARVAQAAVRADVPRLTRHDVLWLAPPDLAALWRWLEARAQAAGEPFDAVLDATRLEERAGGRWR